MGWFNFAKKSPPDKPAPSLEGITLRLDEIPDAIKAIEDFPRVDWPLVEKALHIYADHPTLDPLWTEMAAQWLDAVAARLGQPYHVHEGKHVLLLSSLEPGGARRFVNLGDETYDRLEQLLHRSPKERGLGKHAILLLDKAVTYYEYISHFYPESDRPYGASAGVHISSGYRHTVIHRQSKREYHTLVHELAHEMVSHRPIPRWLNEGLAQVAEDMIPGYHAALIDARGVRTHQRYWSWFGMRHFWDGRAFSAVSSQALSYQLSHILFCNLVSNRSRRRQLPDFLAAADRKDAGQAACLKCFGCDLSALIEEFLGPGPWK